MGRTDDASGSGRSDHHQLVRLARQAVETYVKEKRYLERPPHLDSELAEHAGVFVCLKKGGHLRGCIGTFEPIEGNVAEETIHNAVSAALHDPRFPPVSNAELASLEYSVDVLTPPEPVASPSDLDPKRYGVIVRQGHRRGLLLPDLEGVESVEEQLRIARQKAGIGLNEPAEIYRFEVRRFT